MAEYENLMISGGASTVSHSVVWLTAKNCEDEIVAYLCSNHVQIYEMKTKRVEVTLKSQEDRLDCLAGLYSSVHECFFLVTGSEKGVVNVWQSQSRGQNNLNHWKLLQSISVPSGASISCVAAIIDNKSLLLSVGDAKGHCYIYREAGKVLVLSQTLNFPSSQLSNVLHFRKLHQDLLALCIGAVDAKLHIFVQDSVSQHSDGESEAVSHSFRAVGHLWGHEEWITCLDSVQIEEPATAVSLPTTTYVASGSQDNKIRIWKIVSRPITAANAVIGTSVDRAVVASVDEDEDEDEDGDEGTGKGAQTQTSALEEDLQDSEARLSFTNASRTILFQVYLESLLLGHEDWVTSVTWLPTTASTAATDLALFSTSMDRNMVVWAPDAALGGVWTPIVRVGDVGGALGGSVGGNLLGFVAGCVSPYRGDRLLGIGYGGSFHYWCQEESNDGTSVRLAESRWMPQPFLSGHFEAVSSVAWAGANADGDDYLLSCAADQTCRLFLPIVGSANSSSSTPQWKEISRPLIHGYNLNAVVPRRSGAYKLLAASDEKIIRVFTMPHVVTQGLQVLGGISVQRSEEEITESVDSAFIPELGLSNKPRALMSSAEQKEHEARNVSAVDWSAPIHRNGLLESQLADYTIWLEVKKLYGHAFDVLCLSQVSGCGRYVASSCRAKFAQTQHTPAPSASKIDMGSAGGLGVLVWDLTTYEIIARLEDGHEGSVVSLCFSPDGRFLASCGKDRSICIHMKETDPSTGSVTFVSILAVKNAHKRIIWDASWTADSTCLITGSRDGAVKLWYLENLVASSEAVAPTGLINVHTFSPFASSSNPAVTALDVYHYQPTSSSGSGDQNGNDVWLVLGSGGGDMEVHRLHVIASGSPHGAPSVQHQERVLAVDAFHSHASAVRRVQWRRPSASIDITEHSKDMVWASCGEDHTVRIHRLRLT